MSGKIYQGSRLVAQTNDAPLGFEDKGIELENLAQYEQLKKDGNLQEDVNYYIKDGQNAIVNECLARAKSTGWWHYGESTGLPPGLLRTGYIPQKIVFLGNSFTAHRPVEEGAPEGYVWTVYDWRAMAASTPTSDWTQIVRNKLKEINPDLKAFKASVVNWEGGTAGQRSYDLIKNDESCAEIRDDGGHYLTGTTIDDILTDDVDVIIWQAYENAEAPDTSTAEAFTNDYMNIFDALRAKCPKATIYDYCGWWSDSMKDQCIVCACAIKDVQMINQWETKLPAWAESVKPTLEAQVGDEIYDAEGKVICTVDNVVAGHANDLGHKYIAFYVLNRLFNGASSIIPSLALGANQDEVDAAGFFDANNYDSAVYYNATTMAAYNPSALTDFDHIYFEDCISASYAFDNIRHSVFGSKLLEKRAKYGPTPTIQTLKSYGSTNYGAITLQRTWVPDRFVNAEWNNWIVEANSYFTNELNSATNTNEFTAFNGFNNLIVKTGLVTDKETGRIDFKDAFPHACLFASAQDRSGGYGGTSPNLYRASYTIACRVENAGSIYVHTMEIKGDGTITVDAEVPEISWIAIGY